MKQKHEIQDMDYKRMKPAEDNWFQNEIIRKTI